MNKVLLNDDELSIIITSLDLSLSGYRKYVSNGNKLDKDTARAIEEMKKIYIRLRNEYFQEQKR